MAIPPARGGEAVQVNKNLPYKPPKPKKPTRTGSRVISTRPLIDPAYTDAFSLFRQTMGALRKYTPQVDQAAISAPYTAGQQAATSLATGLQNATNAQTQLSQQNYGTARNSAAQGVTGFSAAAGGGAGPTIEDRGTSLIAQQGQTNANAALAAGTAWNQLLERMRAQAIDKAQLGRQDLISQGIASAATQIPGLTQQNRTRTFQQDTANKNYLLALGTQHDKESEAERQFLLGQIRANETAGYHQGLLDQGAARISQGDRKLAAQEKLWQAQAKKAASVAKTFKIAGVPGALSTLRGPKSSSTKTQSGYSVTYQPSDEDGAYGSPTTVHGVADTWQPPAGTIVVAKVPNMTTGGAGGYKFSWSRYKAAVGQLRAQNPGITQQRITQILGPTPKTGKKK